MSDRHQYCVVRYVPSAVRDEAVNVGVLVRDVVEETFVAKFLPRAGAVGKLWPTADKQLVRHLERQLRDASSSDGQLWSANELVRRYGRPGTEEFFRKARAEFTGNLQFTEPRGVKAVDLKAALRWVYQTYVEEPKGVARPINYQAMAPMRVRVRLWRSFERRGLIRKGGVRQLALIQGRHAPWTFDLAYQNGRLNVINSVALDAPSAQTNLGRALVFKGMIEDLRESDNAHGMAVVAQSEEGEGVAQALDLLHDSKIEVIPLLGLEDFVGRVELDLQH